MPIGPRKTHDFVWINLMTPEGEKEKAFFASTLGWTFGEMPGVEGGSLILVEGLAAGALMDLDHARLPPGLPPCIGVMVRVEDADAAVERVKALGGTSDGVFDVMDNGRMASCTDPLGAVFGLWQCKSKVGFEADSAAHGAPSWFETLTTDADRAAVFYGELFGWRPVKQHPVPGMTYTVFELGGVGIAGAMKLLPHAKGVPPHWGTTFTVRDVDAVARLAVEHGGKLCMPADDIPGVGRFALLQSPRGVSFSVIRYAPRA
jgi:predicted enzyme related to lactoylglutathione lyase